MALAYEYFTGVDTAAAAGLFIPRANLPGMATSEFDDTNIERKVALAVMNALFSGLSTVTAPLGLAVTKATPAGISADVINQGFTATVQYYADHGAGTVGVYPLPVGNAGLVSLESIFGSGISIVSAGGATNEGVVIPNSVITSAGGAVPANTTADARDWLQAILLDMVNNLTTSTAVPTRSRNTAAGVAIPTNLTTITNLTDASKLSFFSHTYSLTFQLSLNQSTQTFDLAA